MVCPVVSGLHRFRGGSDCRNRTLIRWNTSSNTLKTRIFSAVPKNETLFWGGISTPPEPGALNSFGQPLRSAEYFLWRWTVRGAESGWWYVCVVCETLQATATNSDSIDTDPPVYKWLVFALHAVRRGGAVAVETEDGRTHIKFSRTKRRRKAGGRNGKRARVVRGWPQRLQDASAALCPAYSVQDEIAAHSDSVQQLGLLRDVTTMEDAAAALAKVARCADEGSRCMWLLGAAWAARARNEYKRERDAARPGERRDVQKRQEKWEVKAAAMAGICKTRVQQFYAVYVLREEFPGIERINPKHIGIRDMAAHKSAVVKALRGLPGRVRNM